MVLTVSAFSNESVMDFLTDSIVPADFPEQTIIDPEIIVEDTFTRMVLHTQSVFKDTSIRILDKELALYTPSFRSGILDIHIDGPINMSMLRQLQQNSRIPLHLHGDENICMDIVGKRDDIKRLLSDNLMPHPLYVGHKSINKLENSEKTIYWVDYEEDKQVNLCFGDEDIIINSPYVRFDHPEPDMELMIKAEEVDYVFKMRHVMCSFRVDKLLEMEREYNVKFTIEF